MSLFLAVLLLTSNLSVFARASDYIDSVIITPYAQGGGVVKFTLNIGGTHNNMTKIGFQSVTLYERADSSSSWKSAASYYNRYNPNATAGGHTFTCTYDGVAGRQYYAEYSAYAQDAKGSDTKSGSSNVVTAT